MMKKPAKKSSTPGVKRQQMIVFVDGNENYYEFSRAAVERSKVEESRKKKVAECLKDEPIGFIYINQATIPGSTVSPALEGGRQLHYAGFYLRPTKRKS
jgi:hypothetical protein